MKNNLLNITFLILIVFCCSCSIVRPFERIKSDDFVQLINDTTIYKFDGNYKVTTINTSPFSLDYTFLYSQPFGRDSLKSSNRIINIKTINNRKLKVFVVDLSGKFMAWQAEKTFSVNVCEQEFCTVKKFFVVQNQFFSDVV